MWIVYAQSIQLHTHTYIDSSRLACTVAMVCGKTLRRMSVAPICFFVMMLEGSEWEEIYLKAMGQARRGVAIAVF